MLRVHNTTLEYIENQDTYVLNVDGHTTYITHEDMMNLSGYMMEKDVKSAEDIAEYLKNKDPDLYKDKFIPLSDNPNAYDVYEVIKLQLEKPVYTQKPSR